MIFDTTDKTLYWVSGGTGSELVDESFQDSSWLYPMENLFFHYSFLKIVSINQLLNSCFQWTLTLLNLWVGIFVEKHFEVKEYWEKLNFELEWVGFLTPNVVPNIHLGYTNKAIC